MKIFFVQVKLSLKGGPHVLLCNNILFLWCSHSFYTCSLFKLTVGKSVESSCETNPEWKQLINLEILNIFLPLYLPSESAALTCPSWGKETNREAPSDCHDIGHGPQVDEADPTVWSWSTNVHVYRDADGSKRRLVALWMQHGTFVAPHHHKNELKKK